MENLQDALAEANRIRDTHKVDVTICDQPWTDAEGNRRHNYNFVCVGAAEFQAMVKREGYNWQQVGTYEAKYARS